MQNNNQAKIDYRRKRHLQPNEVERELLKSRLYNFSTSDALSRVFSCTPANITMAFSGNNATLMNKIKIYIEKMETRNGGSNVSTK